MTQNANVQLNNCSFDCKVWSHENDCNQIFSNIPILYLPNEHHNMHVTLFLSHMHGIRHILPGCYWQKQRATYIVKEMMLHRDTHVRNLALIMLSSIYLLIMYMRLIYPRDLYNQTKNRKKTTPSSCDLFIQSYNFIFVSYTLVQMNQSKHSQLVLSFDLSQTVLNNLHEGCTCYYLTLLTFNEVISSPLLHRFKT